MTWGSAWELNVGLLAQTAHPSDASFLATARLVDVQWFDATHQRITDVALSAISGTDQLAATVPEPPAWALWVLGLLGVVLRRRPTVSKAWCHVGCLDGGFAATRHVTCTSGSGRGPAVAARV